MRIKDSHERTANLQRGWNLQVNQSTMHDLIDLWKKEIKPILVIERRSYNMSKKNEIQRQSWMNREPAAWGILSRVGTCNAKQSTRMSSIVRDPEWKTNPFWRKTFLQHIEEEWESKTIINELQTFRCMMRETYMQTLSCRQNPEATANLMQVRTQTTKRTCLQGPQACCCSSADCTACEENNCHFAGTKPGAACGW